MHNANVVRLLTIEICIDDGCAEIGRCWLTTRYAATGKQIQRVCRAYGDIWKAVEFPVLGVFWRYVGEQRWHLAAA